MTADAVVIWSVLWAGRMANNKSIYHHYREQGRPVIVIDVGALYRGTTWKIAVGNITADGYYGHTVDLDWDRPKKLGLSLGYTPKGNESILIAAQHNQSLQVDQLPSIEHWIRDQIDLARKHTDRPIAIRPHPRCQLDLSLLPQGIKIESPKPVPHTYDNFDLRFDYQALISYNSGPGIQAAIEGCPVIVDRSSLASPVSVRYEDIERRAIVNRDQWFVEICHTEYTIQEIRQGLWLKRIKQALL